VIRVLGQESERTLQRRIADEFEEDWALGLSRDGLAPKAIIVRKAKMLLL